MRRERGFTRGAALTCQITRALSALLPAHAFAHPWHEPCESSSNQKLLCWSHFMKRRDFLKSVSGLAAGAALPAMPSVISSAKADARSETLLIVSEGGPNNLDIH